MCFVCYIYNAYVLSGCVLIAALVNCFKISGRSGGMCICSPTYSGSATSAMFFIFRALLDNASSLQKFYRLNLDSINFSGKRVINPSTGNPPSK